jgi:hypothetical protein
MVHPVAEADERRPFGRLTPEEFYARHGVTHSTSTFINPRGLRIFTQRSTPSRLSYTDTLPKSRIRIVIRI